MRFAVCGMAMVSLALFFPVGGKADVLYMLGLAMLIWSFVSDD